MHGGGNVGDSRLSEAAGEVGSERESAKTERCKAAMEKEEFATQAAKHAKKRQLNRG
jgi:hypothetical protein